MGRWSVVAAGVAVLAVGAASALAGHAPTSPAAATPSAVRSPSQVPGDEVGATLYGRDCASCHGPDGRGSWRGPSLAASGTAGTYYALATGRMPIPDERAPVRRGPPHYSPEEIEALVGHVDRLVDGPALPELDLAAADVPLGGSLYRLHCGQCHSSTGIGGALLYGKLAPPLLRSEPAVVAAAVVAGPGAMPAFSPAGLTDHELASVVAYVQEIQHPADEGGFPLARAGRVDEGLVGWGVGVTTLALAAGWIARPVRR